MSARGPRAGFGISVSEHHRRECQNIVRLGLRHYPSITQKAPVQDGDVGDTGRDAPRGGFGCALPMNCRFGAAPKRTLKYLRCGILGVVVGAAGRESKMAAIPSPCLPADHPSLRGQEGFDRAWPASQLIPFVGGPDVRVERFPRRLQWRNRLDPHDPDFFRKTAVYNAAPRGPHAPGLVLVDRRSRFCPFGGVSKRRSDTSLDWQRRRQSTPCPCRRT